MRAAVALTAPADAVRAAGLRLLGPALAPLFRDRSRRVAWWGAVLVAWTLGLALAAPLWALALGPLVLGVPHLLADVRYLVVRPGLHRNRWLWLAAPPLLAASLSAPAWVGLLSVLPAVVAARGTVARRSVVVAACAALLAVAVTWERSFQFAFLHLHNVIALGLWWVWRPRTARMSVVPALVVLGCLAIALGAAEPVLTAAGGWTAPWTGLEFGTLSQQLSGLDDDRLALRLVVLFCFLQGMHYAAWLRLVPEDDRPRAAPRPFHATLAALVDDFGWWPLLVTLALALFIAGWGLLDVAGARLGYLRLAGFHGYLELAAAAFFFIERRRP